MSDTPEIAGAKQRLELQATSPGVPNWARQLLTYIEDTERELSEARAENAALKKRIKLGADLLVETNRLQEGIVARLEAERDKLREDAERYEYMLDCDYRAAKLYLPSLSEEAHKSMLRAKHRAAINAAKGEKL